MLMGTFLIVPYNINELFGRKFRMAMHTLNPVGCSTCVVVQTGNNTQTVA